LAMSYISDHCVEYKNAHKNLKSLSNRQTQRIKVMNRLENLSRRWNKHEPNPTKNLDYMLGEKFVEGYLMTQVKGKDATKYIKTFCDSEKVHENAKKIAESHPFEKYHGAQLSKDIKKQFLYKPCVKAYENSLSLLKMKEKEYQELLKTEDGIINYDVNPEPNVKEDGPSIKSQPIKQQNSSSIKM